MNIEDIKEKLSQFGRPLAAGVVVAAAIVGISIASNNNDEVEQPQDDMTSSEVVQEDEINEGSSAEVVGSEEAIGSQPSAGPVEVEANEEAYASTAREGDNQTVIVRQMVNQHVLENELSLNASQRLYMETVLVNTLPRDDTIAIGDVITLSKVDVAAEAEKASELTQAQQDAWARYL